jgi:hypothetical protein
VKRPLAVAALFVAALFVAPRVFASSMLLQTGTYLGTAPEVVYYGGAWYWNDQGEPGVGVYMAGNLSLFNPYGDRIRNHEWGTIGGVWQSEFSAFVDWGFCYSSAINAQTFDRTGQQYGNTTCVPQPPPNDPPEIVPVCCQGEPHNTRSEPLLLDLNGDGIHTTEPDVRFDLTGDGAADLASWSNGATEEGFLYLDLNRNGIVDGGQELFGDVTFLPNGSRARHGFEALAAYDAPAQGGNGDGIISAGDRVWGSLRVWVDRNHDGIATHDENDALPAVQVVSISLAWETFGADRDYGRDAANNYHVFQGTFTQRVIHNGRPELVERAAHDIYFRIKP